MAAHHGVGVVEVEGVPRRPVDERGGERRGALATADQRRPSGVFGPRDGLEEDPGQRLARPRERAAEEVQQAVAGRRPGGGGGGLSWGGAAGGGAAPRARAAPLFGGGRALSLPAGGGGA